jgi:SPOR domain
VPTRMPHAFGEAHERPRRSRFLLVGLPVCAVFAAFGIFAWIAYQENAHLPVGEPPLIKAAAGPFKLAPDDPGGREVADQGAINALLSDEPRPALPERVLPLPEEPRTPTLTAAGPPEEPEPAAAPEATPGPTREPEGAAKEAEAALAKLLADAGSEPAPPPPERQAAAVEQPAAAPATAAAAPAGRPTPPPPVADAPAAATADPAPAVRADGPSREADEALTRLLAEIAGEPVTPDAQASAPANEPPRAVAAIVPAEPTSRPRVGGGGFRIQLAAVRDEADAARAWAGLVDRLGSLVADYEPYYQRAETSNGVFYRIQVGSFASERAADAVCVEVQRRNASCFVVAAR